MIVINRVYCRYRTLTNQSGDPTGYLPKGIGGSPGQYMIVVRVTARLGKCQVDQLEDWGCKISRKGMHSH